MKVHELTPAPGSRKRAKRVGRGTGGRGGKTAGRGTKGQRARGTVAPGFEGGQMPLKQRVPKLKGFNNPFRVQYQAVNLHTLADLAPSLDGAAVTPDLLVERGIVRKGAFVKVLARGELTTSVELHVHAISAAAERAVTAAGGTVTLVPLPFREEGKAGRPAAQGNQFANR